MKGIREAALSQEETTPVKRLQGYYPEDDFYDPYGGGHYGRANQNSLFENNYGKKNKAPYAIPDTLDEFELHDGEFEINLVVGMKELGAAADPDDDKFEFDIMNIAAQDKGIVKLEKLIPDLYKNYTITTSSIENIDDITVTIKLKPIKK